MKGAMGEEKGRIEGKFGGQKKKFFFGNNVIICKKGLYGRMEKIDMIK
jgi:hypothetical protein